MASGKLFQKAQAVPSFSKKVSKVSQWGNSDPTVTNLVPRVTLRAGTCQRWRHLWVGTALCTDEALHHSVPLQIVSKPEPPEKTGQKKNQRHPSELPLVLPYKNK